MFIHRVRNLVAIIQCVSEELEAKDPRIPFPEAYECSIYTAAKWQLLYPNNNQYTGHLTDNNDSNSDTDDQHDDDEVQIVLFLLEEECCFVLNKFVVC